LAIRCKEQQWFKGQSSSRKSGTRGSGQSFPKDGLAKSDMRCVTLAAIGLLAVAAGNKVLAQGAVINTPGQPPTTATPNSSGGYTLTTPGQMPRTMTPNYNGGYTINTPGQRPSMVTPNSAGGYTINTPGQGPTTLTPNSSGGYTASPYGAR